MRVLHECLGCHLSPPLWAPPKLKDPGAKRFYPNLHPSLASNQQNKGVSSQKLKQNLGVSRDFSGISISILFFKLTIQSIHHPRMLGLSRRSGILHVNGCATGTLHSDSEKQYDAATRDYPKADLRGISVSQHAVSS